MNIRNFLSDDEAVSPVIGVILMVAITVILAAVIGAFVLGIGSSQEKAPQASWDFSYDDNGDGFSDNDDAVTIAHDGGENVDNSSLSFTIGGSTIDGTNLQWDGTKPTSWSAGTSKTVSEISTGSGPISSGADVVVTWTTSSGDSSQIIGEGTVP